MLTPLIPDDERERMADLRAVALLDTPPEDRFDRITRLLTRVFRVPWAYLSLIDSDRQWFKSSQGLDVIETPREVSFCGHAILSDEIFVVPDATRDERFLDNPLVTGEPGIRFYAGHPLKGPNGRNIGTLCIADREARTLDDYDRRTFREVAAIVQRELGLVEVVALQKLLLEAREQAAEAERRRTETLEQLVASQRRLVRELDQAAGYVRALLPRPIDLPPVRTRYRFEPSSALGGDSFGYEWLDPEHFGIYLVDVSGHGVGAALLTVSVVNTLRARALGGVDLRDPAAVLNALNDAFPMDRHDGKYFTMWYGVYHPSTRRLRYASAAHPPALLVSGSFSAAPLDLGEPSFGIGMMLESNYRSFELEVPAGSRLEVFSDGVFEFDRPDGSIASREELVEWLADPAGVDPDSIWRRVVSEAADPNLRDDFSLLQATFD